MGQQIDELSHSCGTRKALKVFAQENGTVDGYCFACFKRVEDPYGDQRKVKDIPVIKKKTDEDIKAQMEEIAGFRTVAVPARKLRREVLEYFGAKTSLSEADGVTPTAIFWPITVDGELTGYHVKTLGEHKFVYNVGNTKNGDLIGWSQAKINGGWRLVITEGPEDMASVHRMYEMYDTNEQYKTSVVSLPRGAGSAKAVIGKHLQDIKAIFKEVVFCFDDDKAGHDAVQNAMQLLPTAKSVVLPYKDANECLVKGAAKAAYDRLSYRAAVPKNTRVLEAHTLHDLARQPAKFGELTWPFPKLNTLTRGVRWGETGYIGAGVKMGKGELRNELIAHFIREDRAKVFVASFEESNAKTYKLIAGKIASKIFHDPEIPFDEEAFDEAGKVIKDNLYVLNLYQHANWKTLKQDIIQSVNEGVKVVMIDPITNLTNGVNAADANTLLQEVAQDFSAMALDMSFTGFMFCHLKAPEGHISGEAREKLYKEGKYIGLGNCDHEWGGNAYSNQFTGSRAMMR